MTCCNAVPEVLLYACDTGNDRHGLSSDLQPLHCVFSHKHFGDQIVCFKNMTCYVLLPLSVAGHCSRVTASSSKQHFRQVVERCLVYESNK